MSSMNGKVVLITGASSGIGRATAEAFAAKGAKVALAQFQSRYLQQPEAAEKTPKQFIAEEPDNLPLQLPVGSRQSFHAALRLLSLLKERDVRNCHPAPFPWSADGDCGDAVKVGPETCGALL